MKKLISVLLAVAAILSLTACEKEKIVLHCDGCGKELTFDADSGMTEDWIILCDDCRASIDE